VGSIRLSELAVVPIQAQPNLPSNEASHNRHSWTAASYKIDGQLMHSRNPDAEELMWILMFADDISLVCDDIESLGAAVTLMDATFVQWGLTISTKKTLKV